MNKKIVSLLATATALALLGGLSIATPDLSPPAAASGTVIVPDRFLRRWDPITIFFPKDVAEPGPEDHPEKWLTMTPHPGAFTWIDARTLQFRPAEPWPALSRISIAVKNRPSVTLATLMSPPA